MEFTPKEEDIIVYLAGYVLGTLYRRMRFSKMNKSMYHQQCLSISLAGKLTSSTSDTVILVLRINNTNWLI